MTDIVEHLREIASTKPGEQTLWDCTVAAWAADEIERLRAYAKHERDLGAEEVAMKDAEVIQNLIDALKDAQTLIDNDLVGPWIAAHKLDEILKSKKKSKKKIKSKWKCPIDYPNCKKNCGEYGCGN